MIVRCGFCDMAFDDEFRDTQCPHDTFAANDGKNNFAHHPESVRNDKIYDPDNYKISYTGLVANSTVNDQWVKETCARHRECGYHNHRVFMDIANNRLILESFRELPAHWNNIHFPIDIIPKPPPLPSLRNPRKIKLVQIPAQRKP